MTPREAREVQEALRSRVLRVDRLGEIRHVAGVDVHFDRRAGTSRAAVAVLTVPGLEVVDEVVARAPTTFPYVPGLLSFRELPPALLALERIRRQPDLFVCDAQGYAHPRRFGLACHLGVLADVPTIGVAKSRLVGAHDDVPAEKGSWVPLTDGDEVIGAAVRTRARVKPVYVSVGHRLSLDTAIALTLDLTTRYRLPDPCRAAHRLASRD